MKNVLIGIIKTYKMFISPMLPGACRFYPSCSDYAIDALKMHGALKGALLSARRVARCNPFHPGGFDPVR